MIKLPIFHSKIITSFTVSCMVPMQLFDVMHQKKAEVSWGHHCSTQRARTHCEARKKETYSIWLHLFWHAPLLALLTSCSLFFSSTRSSQLSLSCGEEKCLVSHWRLTNVFIGWLKPWFGIKLWEKCFLNQFSVCWWTPLMNTINHYFEAQKAVQCLHLR